MCFIIFSQSWGDDEDEHFVDAPEEDEETPMKERNEDDSIATESPKSKAPSWLHRKNVYHKGKLRFSAGFVAVDLLFGCPRSSIFIAGVVAPNEFCTSLWQRWQ